MVQWRIYISTTQAYLYDKRTDKNSTENCSMYNFITLPYSAYKLHFFRNKCSSSLWRTSRDLFPSTDCHQNSSIINTCFADYTLMCLIKLLTMYSATLFQLRYSQQYDTCNIRLSVKSDIFAWFHWNPAQYFPFICNIVKFITLLKKLHNYDNEELFTLWMGDTAISSTRYLTSLLPCIKAGKVQYTLKEAKCYAPSYGDHAQHKI